MAQRKCVKGCDFFGSPDYEGMCSKCWKDFLRSIGGDVPSEKPSAEGKSSVLKAEEKLYGGSIQVRLGDLTTEKVDAIINAANRALGHASGLAGAIVKKGGDIIQDESDIYVLEHGKLKDGDVCHTHAGRLPCKYVIHTVGPVWRAGKENEEAVLALAMRNTLIEADKLKCKSISVPAISSGLFNFPKDKCARILFDTTTAYLKEHEGKSDSTVKEIRFTNFDDGTVKCFTQEFERRQREKSSDKKPDSKQDGPGPADSAPKSPEKQPEGKSDAVASSSSNNAATPSSNAPASNSGQLARAEPSPGERSADNMEISR